MENIYFRTLLLDKLRMVVDCSQDLIHSEEFGSIQIDALKQSLVSMYQAVISSRSDSENESIFELKNKIDNWQIQKVQIRESELEETLLSVVMPIEHEEDELVQVSPIQQEVESEMMEMSTVSSQVLNSGIVEDKVVSGFNQLSFEVITEEETSVNTEKNPLDIFSSLQSKFQNQGSVYQKLYGEKEEETAHCKKPIDLKSAIGINEKFLFINDLFKGNMKECTDMILSINDAENMEAAISITDSFKMRYAWDESGNAYSTLFDFLKRRFPNS